MSMANSKCGTSNAHYMGQFEILNDIVPNLPQRVIDDLTESDESEE